MVGSDGEVVRVVGTLADVTDIKTSEERILHDAVHDNLTGLPNRRLFLDRLDAALTLSRTDDSVRPTVIVLDIDRFKQINESVGLPAGDSILLAMARRLGRLLKPQDTLARVTGDQFAMLLALRARARPHHRCWPTPSAACVAAPVMFGDREIFMTASIGIALPDPSAQIARRGRAAQRRDRDDARQAPGRRPDRGVPPGHARAAHRPAGAGDGPAARAGAQRDQGAVPAHRAAGGPHRRRLRGADALGSSQARAARRRASSSPSPRRAG